MRFEIVITIAADAVDAKDARESSISVLAWAIRAHLKKNFATAAEIVDWIEKTGSIEVRERSK